MRTTTLAAFVTGLLALSAVRAGDTPPPQHRTMATSPTTRESGMTSKATRASDAAIAAISSLESKLESDDRKTAPYEQMAELEWRLSQLIDQWQYEGQERVTATTQPSVRA